ncbi:MAG TPA: protein kinase, partial [Terrimicrobiaceae bacterium]
MEFGGTLILPSDVLIVPVASLSSTVRRQIQAEADDFAISRPSTRSRSRVINAAAAELLQQFREPRTIVEAILRYSQAKGLDPKNVLEYAFPLLRPLLAERLLTPSDSSEARRIEPTFPAGATLAGCLINCCVQTMEDTEVYRAIAPKGESVAIKIVRPNARAEVTTRLEMEGRILTHLDGTVSPVLRGRGAEAGRPFLLLEWCHGTDAAAAAARLRQTGSEADAVALLRLGGAILRAFSSLHDQGVIHGDIHPKNVLISSDGRAKVIDFGFAHLSTTNTTFRDPTRGGVGYYFEPEYAHACLRNEEPPPATEAGEQYALAALLYYLFAGEHYLSFSLGREDFLRQIAAETPLSFSERGLTHWPDLERILSRALHKDPAARFASLRNFAEEWETVALPFSGARLPSARA